MRSAALTMLEIAGIRCFKQQCHGFVLSRRVASVECSEAVDHRSRHGLRDIRTAGVQMVNATEPLGSSLR